MNAGNDDPLLWSEQVGAMLKSRKYPNGITARSVVQAATKARRRRAQGIFSPLDIPDPVAKTARPVGTHGAMIESPQWRRSQIEAVVEARRDYEAPGGQARHRAAMIS